MANTSNEPSDLKKRDEFDSPGEAVGYISLDQAVLQAHKLVQQEADAYRERLGWGEIVGMEQSSEHREDSYRVVLQFKRPARGLREEQTGEEEFVFELTGGLAFRQVVAWPVGLETLPSHPASPTQPPPNIDDLVAYDDMILQDMGANKIMAIKAVREVTTLGLREAKELVESAPAVIRSKVERQEADEIKQRLESAGAVVIVRGR